MSATDSELLREKIRLALTVGARATPDAASIARSTLRTWKQVISRLTPVIGTRGVEVLFNRSLHLTNRAFPWLGGTSERGVSALENLRGRLEEQEVAVATEASSSMLLTFAELLAGMIGSALTTRMLMPVLGSALATDEEPKP